VPINRRLKDKRTPEEIELLNKTFNHALNLLGVVGRNDPLCDMVARKVIEVGATGISEPGEIAEMAVAGLAYGKAASVGGLFHFASRGEAAPAAGGWGAGGAAIPTAGNAETSGQR